MMQYDSELLYERTMLTMSLLLNCQCQRKQHKGTKHNEMLRQH